MYGRMVGTSELRPGEGKVPVAETASESLAEGCIVVRKACPRNVAIAAESRPLYQCPSRH
jgi:hypothetical protein